MFFSSARRFSAGQWPKTKCGQEKRTNAMDDPEARRSASHYEEDLFVCSFTLSLACACQQSYSLAK